MLIIRRHVKVISKVSPTWFVRLIGVVFLELGRAIYADRTQRQVVIYRHSNNRLILDIQNSGTWS